VGADWILDRMRSIVNITNDTILCRIIAHQCDETVEAQLNQGNVGMNT
jgi:Na+/H+-dicarboxylate symporter